MSHKRLSFIDAVQEWFRQRSRFWTVISLTSLASVIVLQILLILIGASNPYVRQGIDSILVPMLALFVFSIFWRGFAATVLSLAGVTSLYAGIFYVYSAPIVVHKYKIATLITDPQAVLYNINILSVFYFLGGVLTLFLCVAVAFKPSLFYAKGTRYKQPYPIWSSDDYQRSSSHVNARQLVPVIGLLSLAERYLVANAKYIVVVIGGRTYFVSPNDWVPEGSMIIRDKEGSLSGVSDSGSIFGS